MHIVKTTHIKCLHKIWKKKPRNVNDTLPISLCLQQIPIQSKQVSFMYELRLIHFKPAREPDSRVSVQFRMVLFEFRNATLLITR